MRYLAKQLWLLTTLILAASLLLLLSDLDQRVNHNQQGSKDYPSIAIMQITSTSLLDDHVQGIINRLEEKGYRGPEGENIRLFNPQGDYSTANSIARDIVNSPYDMVITSSTLALQVVSKANIATQKIHVFGAVTDPYGAGVGISGPKPDQHPPYMAGVGTFQPVKKAVRIAYGMNPELKRLGVVWNPGEQCSEACVLEARQICRELGIKLVEANAANTSEVAEATRSLIARDIEAIWIGGDTVANSSSGLIIKLAKQAGIPVFTNDPSDIKKGALFGLGANYFTVGRYTADIAIAILDGKSPSTISIENVIPNKLGLNQKLLTSLRGKWDMTPAVQELLDKKGSEIIKGALEPEPGTTSRVESNYPAKVLLVKL